MPSHDLDYVRRLVPIRAVAEQLALRITGKMVHCWRPDNHQYGDRTASVGLDERRNSAKCFVCDSLPLSPIDLVMSVLGLGLPVAIRWITSRWNVPILPKGKHLQHTQRWPERFRVGTSGSSGLEVLVRSGIWAHLTPAQHSILPVLVEYAGPEKRVTISYRGIMRYSGVRSATTIATAVKRFRYMRILTIEASKDSAGFRGCNSYRLTLDDTEFLALANRTVETQRKAIAEEKELRVAVRRQRRPLLPVTSLSNGCSAVEFDAPATRSANMGTDED